MVSTYIFLWMGRHWWVLLCSRLRLQMLIYSHPSLTTGACRHAVKIWHIFMSGRWMISICVLQMCPVIVLRRLIIVVEKFAEAIFVRMWPTGVCTLGMNHCVNLCSVSFGLRKRFKQRPVQWTSWRKSSVFRTVVASNEARLLPIWLIRWTTRFQGYSGDCFWHSPTPLVSRFYSSVQWK